MTLSGELFRARLSSWGDLNLRWSSADEAALAVVEDDDGDLGQVDSEFGAGCGYCLFHGWSGLGDGSSSVLWPSRGGGL